MEIKGKIVHTKHPEDLWLFDNTQWQMISLGELVIMRLNALHGWWFWFFRFLMTIKVATGFDFIKRISRFQVWRYRITTCTHMVYWHAQIFFYNHQRPEKQAFRTKLSDGGIEYTPYFLQTMDYSRCSRILHQPPLMPGGNFTADEFAEHPVFSSACNDVVWKHYVELLNRLSTAFDFYHPGIFSGWVPQNIQPGYGRPISLGYAGEAWYPPNNSTVGHTTILLPLAP